MMSLQMPTTWETTLVVITLLIVVAISQSLRKPKSFKVPIVGGDIKDINTLKARYVREADVILREGYEKVGEFTEIHSI